MTLELPTCECELCEKKSARKFPAETGTTIEPPDGWVLVSEWRAEQRTGQCSACGRSDVRGCCPGFGVSL